MRFCEENKSSRANVERKRKPVFDVCVCTAFPIKLQGFRQLMVSGEAREVPFSPRRGEAREVPFSPRRGANGKKQGVLAEKL
jgi:hypothetical protein